MLIAFLYIVLGLLVSITAHILTNAFGLPTWLQYVTAFFCTLPFMMKAIDAFVDAL
jgi:hypothetical protein